MSEQTDSGTSLPDPPAANQGKDEPIAASPTESPQSMETDDVRSAANLPNAATMPAGTTGGVPTPGDSKGVSVPSVQAAAGSSEESEAVQGVRTTALAPPGKPDGEVDTRG